MKKIIYTIIGSAFILLSGCTDLDQSPHESFSAEDAFKNPTDAQAWVDGMYAKLRTNIRGRLVEAPEYQADLLNATIGQQNYAELHRWDSFLSNESNVAGIWRDSYNAIANINKGLAGFDKIPEQNEIRHFRGELYLARALYYTNLVTLFCKAYDESTAETDLGLSLDFSDEIKEFTERSSLKATYEHILSDIAQAKEFLSGKANQAGSDTFTPDAATALEARVLLYMGKWQQAYNVASSLVDAGSYPLASSQTELEGVWYDDDEAESIVQLYATNLSTEQPTQMNFIGLVLNNRAEPMDFVIPPVLPTQDFVDLYDSADYRKEVFLSQRKTSTQDMVYVINKYPGNPALRIGTQLSYAHKPKVFRIAEQYVIAAEAAYNNGDTANALKYLNLLRNARGLTAYSGSDLLQEIKNERTRELAFEGYRLFDLKRWKQDVVRGTPQTTSGGFILNDNPSQLTELNRPYTDYKMVWPILVEDVEGANGRLTQNPGW